MKFEAARHVAEDARGEDAATTIGVTGLPPRWSVSGWGQVTPWGDLGQRSLDWFVAADDRWHVPASEPTVRQRRIEGTPVVETRVRVPDGDAVQRVWAVPERGGLVVVEFENESPMPFAVALTGAEVITERPPTDVPIQGIDLPDDAIVLPIGHQATARIVWPAEGIERAGVHPHAVPPMLSVVRGWTQVVEQASRVVLPDEALVDALVAARCDLLLEGPVSAHDDPVGFLLDVAEMVRCGDSAGAWLPEVVEPAERIAKSGSRRSIMWRPGRRSDQRRTRSRTIWSSIDVNDAFAAARLVAARADDQLAVDDLDRLALLVAGRDAEAEQFEKPGPSSLADVRRGSSVGRFVRSIERRLADGGRLLPGGMPSGWAGSNFELHGIPTGPATAVSFAVRWHGERPAVLWEQHGDHPIRLSAPDIDPDWSTTEVAGEALWPAPLTTSARSASLLVSVAGAAVDGGGSDDLDVVAREVEDPEGAAPEGVAREVVAREVVNPEVDDREVDDRVLGDGVVDRAAPPDRRPPGGTSFN